MNKTNIGSFIREKRIEQNLTQYTLADRAGVGYRRILEMEKDKKNYSVDVLLDVLSVLGYELSFVEKNKITDPEYSTSIFNFKNVIPAREGDTNHKSWK